MKLFRRFVVMAIAALLMACNTKEPTKELKIPKESTVRNLYSLSISEEYDKLVSQIASCKGMPDTYVSEIVNAYRMRAERIRQIKGGTESFSITTIEPFNSNGEFAADVHIHVNYKDKSEEEVLFRLVFVEGKWMIR